MKFKKFAGLLTLLISFTFVLSACGPSALTENPPSNAPVYGNGGMAVQKGDYLYFVNGYISYASVKEGENAFDKTEYPALYRVKLINNRVDVTIEYDDDGLPVFDPSQKINNTEVIAKRVVGFENMGLYIFGDYIYYTTPNNQKSGQQVLRNDLVDFCRTKLDRSGKEEKLYTTTKSLKDGEIVDYTMYEMGGTVYLVVADGAKIVRAKIENDKIKKAETLVDNSTTTVLNKYTSSEQAVLGFDKYVYYLRNLEDADLSITNKGNAICKVDITNGAKTTLWRDGSTFKLHGVSGGALFYERDNNGVNKMYYNNLAQPDFLTNEAVLINMPLSPYTSFLFLPSGLGRGVVASNGSKVDYFNIDSSVSKNLYTGAVTLVGIQGNFVYMTKDGTVIRVNMVDSSVDEVVASDQNGLLDKTSYADLNLNPSGVTLCYLKKYTNSEGESYYMERVDLERGNPAQEFNSQFVGVMLEKDYLPDPSE